MISIFAENKLNMPSGRLKFLNRRGEIHFTNQGYWVIIIEYFSCNNCTIQFNDGVIRENVRYDALIKGTTEKPIDRTGEKIINCEGYEMEIVRWRRFKDMDVRFNDKYGAVIKNTSYNRFKKGSISNPYHPSVYGVGYTGEGNYSCKTDPVCYVKWHSMLQRSYDLNLYKSQPTYEEVTVCEEWHNFQNFAEWFYIVYDEKTMDSKWCLDKDIRLKGNKIYSPETCCFVPNCINVLFNTSKKIRGEYPIGVQKKHSKFISARLKNTKEKRFNTILEAFNHYKFYKELLIKSEADEWKDRMSKEAYIGMYNWIVEITD